jgi:rubrerythrin
MPSIVIRCPRCERKVLDDGKPEDLRCGCGAHLGYDREGKAVVYDVYEDVERLQDALSVAEEELASRRAESEENQQLRQAVDAVCDYFVCPRCGASVRRDRISLHPAHDQKPPWNTGFEWVGSCPACEKARRDEHEPDQGVRGMVATHLLAHGYHGLYNDDSNCGCELADLMPCTEPSPYCRPGVKKPCDCGEGCDWHIVPREETS